MSASMCRNIFVLFVILHAHLRCNSCYSYLLHYSPNEIAKLIQTSCVIILNTESNTKLLSVFNDLSNVFINDFGVKIGVADLNHFVWGNGEEIRLNGQIKWYLSTENEILFFRKVKLDRNCLVDKVSVTNPLPELYKGDTKIDGLIHYINKNCYTFRNLNGELTHQGIHREYILKSLFSTSSISNITMRTVYDNDITGALLYKSVNSKIVNDSHTTEMDEHCDKEDKNCQKYNTASLKYQKEPSLNPPKLAQCEKLTLPLDSSDFFNNFLKMSKPFILENAITFWPAYKKWTNEFLRKNYGHREVHVKLTPGGDFEGVEKAELWENYKEFKIPEFVRKQLQFPDLVVVRPAAVNMNFSEFLDLITWAAEQPDRNVSAYLEYSSIPNYMPELEEDLEEFAFVKDLKRSHLNMWLSDGNTLGRLHFDPFDNLLCQIRGKKQVIMFEPHNNTKLYEAHIPQATLTFNSTTKKFRRSALEDSTSMVMSPVDILNPDFQRFPKFSQAVPINCTIGEGDVLFMPAFWWHEVYSWPNHEEKRNLAVNFWYEPFLQKEFPCAECKLDVNPLYHHLL